jgi:hypothetical protein
MREGIGHREIKHTTDSTSRAGSRPLLLSSAFALGDVMEELYRFTLLTRDLREFLVDPRAGPPHRPDDLLQRLDVLVAEDGADHLGLPGLLGAEARVGR